MTHQKASSYHYHFINTAGQELLELTRMVESECCRNSIIIMTCSAEDGEALNHLYNADPAKIVEVPNGVDLGSVTHVPLDKRFEAKKRSGLEKSLTVLFIGSWHGPNFEAVRKIINFAKEMPDVNFLIIGSACLAFHNETVPPNIGLMGVVDDETKDIVLGIADIAINPMESGSGTNLKMLDYCLAGIPVISTTHGARGLGLRGDVHIQIAEIGEFPKAIRDLGRKWHSLGQRIEETRNFVKGRCDWAVIASNFVDEVARRKI